MNQRDMKVERVNKMIDELGYDAWDKFITDVKAEGGDIALQYMESRADGIAVVAAMISEYCGWRGSDGTSDHGHEAAMKAAMKVRKRVRKALGYSQP